MGFNLPVLNRRRRLLGTAAFSPSTLFSLSEPGLWLDPSDVANLDWRRNLLTYTEQFDNAAWTKQNSTVTANAGVAPDGMTTADKVFVNSGQASGSVHQSAVFATGQNVVARFNVSNGTFVSNVSGAFDSYSITPFPNSWYRISVVLAGRTASAYFKSAGWDSVSIQGFQDSVRFYPVDSVATTGNGSDGILIWGAQLELGSTATEYQRITDVNTEVIERFPTATLFQDTAGTTPVTTPGQTVALALDKSRGLVLGSELVTNGDFSSGTTGWTDASAVSTVVSGRLRVATTASFGGARQSVSTVIGRTYRLNFTVENGDATGVYIFVGPTDVITAAGNYDSGVLANGTYSVVFTATATTSWVKLVVGGTGRFAFFDNISVRELPGNHATQATLASRPTYGIVPRTGRRNLLTFTEDLTNAVWTKTNTTISADSSATTDPFGGNSADALFETTANGFHSILTASTVVAATAGQSYTFSFYLKANGRTKGFMSVVNGADFTTFDLTAKTNVFGGNGTNVTVTAQTIAELPNGWFRLTSTVSFSGSVNIRPVVGINNDSNVSSYAGDTTKGFYLWGAQLETGSTATAYQRVVSGFDVTEAGVQSLSYLSFDGVDDFLVTPTITPGTDKAQVFAGVRHLSNANYGAMVSFGTTVADPGSLLTWLRSSGGGGQFEAYAKGSSSATTGTVTGTAALTVPATSVFSTLYDIAQSSVTDEIRVRQNGAAMSVAGSSSAGTGNFSAWPMNIGQYNGTQRLHANIFSLIVRFGANLDAGTITSTETWVNSKTGAF